MHEQSVVGTLLELALEKAGKAHPEAAILPLSAKTGAGVDEWVSWVEQALA